MTGALLGVRIRSGFYLDSVALMRISREVGGLPGVAEAALMIGTPANKDLLADAGLLDASAAGAGPNDLILAVRAAGADALAAALDAAEAALDRPAGGGTAADWHPRSLATALETLPAANLAIVSVPGAFAAREARKALEAGLHVMLFSDNVEVADEVALKDLAASRGLLMMGPDCGTAILAGTPLGFANVVARGDVGIIAASGTGAQEVSCLIARAGGGVSHAVGVGGRDLGAAVGGRMTLAAIDALDRDDATRHVVIVSKPPDPATAGRIAERIAASAKRFTVCFLGMAPMALPGNARQAPTLRDAAREAAGAAPPSDAGAPLTPPAGRTGIRGLYAGGSLAAEAQVVLLAAGIPCASNAPVPGARPLGEADARGAVLVDLGADEYTRGRPHPMIEPAVRAAPLAEAVADPGLAVVLLDVVLGYGSHADPAGRVVEAIAGRPAGGPAVVASVCGTEGDPQVYSEQARVLREAGVTVAGSNAEAAEIAARLAGR